MCDRAHENLRHRSGIRQLHWSVPDPVTSSLSVAYDTAAAALADRIDILARRVEGTAVDPHPI